MRLLPRKTTFFDLFDQHAASLVLVSQELREMVHRFDQLEARQARIKELEHRCDEITHEIAREIEKELEYPGQIKVTVIRESRAVEYAR